MAALIVAGGLGLTSLAAQAQTKVHWEFRNYYFSENDSHVEVFFCVGDGKPSKVFVAFDPGDGSEIPGAGGATVQTWWAPKGLRYSVRRDPSGLTILGQTIAFSDTVFGQFTISPTLVEVKKIPLAGKTTIVFQPGTVVAARDLYHRPLSLQTKRLTGDDVWTLQRFLAERGYLEPSGIDGWFGPGTDQAVRQYQAKNQLKVDGIAGQATWLSLAGPQDYEEEYGD